LYFYFVTFVVACVTSTTVHFQNFGVFRYKCKWPTNKRLWQFDNLPQSFVSFSFLALFSVQVDLTVSFFVTLTMAVSWWQHRTIIIIAFYKSH